MAAGAAGAAFLLTSAPKVPGIDAQSPGPEAIGSFAAFPLLYG
jgi:hypothetical protein